MTKDEALKLALKALDVVKLQYTQNRHVNEALAAVNQSLAQPAQPSKAKLLTDQQIRDMCVKYGWDDSYQSIKAYRTVEAMSLELNQLEK
jgi:hypothetical protein